MGTASIVFGIVGICIWWVPGLGWLGAFTGVLGCALGIPSITHWYHKSGYTPWGISGLVLGVTAFDLSVAFQLKVAGGAFDAAVFSVAPITAAPVSLGAAALCAAGLVLARKKNRAAGIAVSAVALALLMVVSAAALVTVDRTYEENLVRASVSG